MSHSDSDEPPGRSAYVARAALDSVVLQQFADLLARRPPKRPPSDVPRPEIDEKLIADDHGAYPPEQGRGIGLIDALTGYNRIFDGFFHNMS